MIQSTLVFRGEASKSGGPGSATLVAVSKGGVKGLELMAMVEIVIFDPIFYLNV